MGRFLLILLCFLHSAAFARVVVLGTGSGSLTKMDMSGLQPGDTIGIRAGTYGYSRFGNLSHITIINYGGQVIFKTDPVEFSNNDHVSFSGTGKPGLTYGFYFLGQEKNAIVTTGHHEACTWSNIEFRDCTGGNGVINPQDAMLQFDGVQNNTKEYYLCRFLHLHLVHCSSFMGNYKGPLLNVQDSCEYGYIVVDSATGPSQISANSFYRANIHHWQLNGSMDHPDTDLGVFVITGNTQIHHCMRKGYQWGWFVRLTQLSLDDARDSYIYNNIDVGSIAYGFVDFRVAQSSTGTLPPVAGNLHVYNNTVGNYKNQNNYVTPVLLNYGTGQYYAEVINNLRFNSRNAPAGGQADTINVVDYSAEKRVRNSHNLYFRDPIRSAVLKDTLNCFLESGSPAIDGGVTVPFVKNDFDGAARPRGAAYDIGARESSEARLLPIRENLPGYSKSVFWLFFPAVILMIAAFFTVKWMTTRRRKMIAGS